MHPHVVPEGKEEFASTLDGIQRYWKHYTLAELKETIPCIELLITGASAVTYSGLRFGKGHGFFDLEWAMLYESGLVDQQSVIYASVHDCQVTDFAVEATDTDTIVDYIVTPAEKITVSAAAKKPEAGIIWNKINPDMLRTIPPLQELWQEITCR